MYTLLSAADSTGVGAIKTLGEQNKEMAFQVILAGSPTGVVIDIEASVDGSNFEQIVQHDVVADGNAFQVNKRFNAFRANLTTLSGGSSPTVTLYAE